MFWYQGLLESAALAGVTTVTGTGAATLGTLTVSGAAAVSVAGELDATLGALTLSGTATNGESSGQWRKYYFHMGLGLGAKL